MAKPERIANQIKAEILRGNHGESGERFMTVRQLAGRFRVSLSTAQKVVRQLKEEGLLVGDSTSPAKIRRDSHRGAGGQSRASRSPRRLGLVITDITNPFFARLCRAIQQAATQEGYQVLVASSDSELARERRAIEGFLEIGIDGLLVCPGLDEACVELYRGLLDREVRLGFVSRRVEGIDADFVVAHNFVGGALVAGHLLSMGYESFGYIAFGPRLKRDERLQGFRSALAEQDAKLPVDQVADGDGRGIEHGYRAMARLMRGEVRPRAVFAFNDLLAIGALGYCREKGIAVPGEVAVAGFDNLPESRVTSPPLSTVAYPVQSIARLAVQSLLDRIEGGKERPAHRILLEPHLVIRQSTDPEAKWSEESAVWGEKAAEEA